MLLLPFSTEELGLGENALLGSETDSKLLVELDGPLPVADAEISVTDEDPGIDRVVDELPGAKDVLDVLFIDMVTKRVLLLLAAGAVLLASLELGRGDWGYPPVVDVLRPPDVNTEAVPGLGASPVAEVDEVSTSDEINEEPPVGWLDGLADGRGGSLLGPEDVGEPPVG